jgi:hypothetical protein
MGKKNTKRPQWEKEIQNDPNAKENTKITNRKEKYKMTPMRNKKYPNRKEKYKMNPMGERNTK